MDLGNRLWDRLKQAADTWTETHENLPTDQDSESVARATLEGELVAPERGMSMVDFYAAEFSAMVEDRLTKKTRS